MQIMKIADYKTFARELGNRTGCGVQIRLIGTEHTHYELDKMGISLGVLCINNGEISFAPFETLDSAQNEQYISVKYLPMVEDLTNVLKIFKDMFVYNPAESLGDTESKKAMEEAYGKEDIY